MKEQAPAGANFLKDFLDLELVLDRIALTPKPEACPFLTLAPCLS